MKKTMLSTKQSYLVCFIGILAAFGIVMALCESGLADSYIKGIMMTACIAIIMTTSLNLTIGVLGQLTLGCCGFEAIGAYVAALTSKYMVAAGIAIDPTARFLLTTLIGGVVACVFGILIGIPALRLHGDYLAIITLGFGEIIRVIIQNLKVAGGMGLDKGAAGQALIGIERTANLYVVFWIMVVTVVVLFMFGRSRYGRAVKAIRDDEIAAGASGLNTTYLKVLVFAISAFFAGIAGGIFAHVLQKLPRLVELAGVGDDPGVQDLFQRFEKRRHLRHKGQRRLFFVAAGLFGQPAGAPQPQQKAQRQRVGVAGGLLGLIARVVGVQCQRLCQRGEVILGPGYGLGPQDAVICRVAALLPQQEQELCIKCPVRSRQRPEQPRADQFKQLHPYAPFNR